VAARTNDTGTQVGSLKCNRLSTVLPIVVKREGLMLSVRCTYVVHDIPKQPTSATHGNEIRVLTQTAQTGLTYATPRAAHAYARCTVKKHHAPELNDVSNSSLCERIFPST
jgi:hypothetical protein